MSAEVLSECRLGEGEQTTANTAAGKSETPSSPKVESKPAKQGDGVDKNTKQNDQSVSSNNTEASKKNLPEAPPPKVNPWTKNNTACPPNNSTNNTQDTESQNSAKVVRANKPRSRKSSKSSDFSDITNWPTPGEIANKEQQQNALNTQGQKVPAGRRERRRERGGEKREKESGSDGSDSKENREAQQETHLTTELEKEAGKDSQSSVPRRRGFRRDFNDETSSVRSEGSSVRGGLRGRGKSRGRGRGRGRVGKKSSSNQTSVYLIGSLQT